MSAPFRRGSTRSCTRVIRSLFLPFFLIYFRLQRTGREHLPASGPLLLAANHRSFLDPFVIGSLVRRPVYYMAKRELFEKPWQAWVLNALGAFPVDRGTGDGDAMRTAREILERGDCVVVFPEGTRIRKGPLESPHKGIGRLALETGAPVAPVAVHGTEQVRRGWRIRPRKVRAARGQAAVVPHHRRVLSGAGRERHRARVGVCDAAVGVAGRRAGAPASRRCVQLPGREVSRAA